MASVSIRINPAGLSIGGGSQINGGSLYVITLDLSEEANTENRANSMDVFSKQRYR